ncbi:GNAT family N-acetyltransferase [Sphingomonas sp. MMS24-JH45]
MNLARAPPYTVEDAAAFLALPRGAHEPRFLVHERFGHHRLIGGVALVPEEKRSRAGYWLAPDAWGRGYATEAGRAVLDIAQHALGLPGLRARHHVNNPASGHVLRKLGFVETGTSRTYSLARGGEVASVEMALTFAATAIAAEEEIGEPAMAA